MTISELQDFSTVSINYDDFIKNPRFISIANNNDFKIQNINKLR